MAPPSAALLDALVATLGVDAERVTLASRLTEDLGADSLDRVELVMAVEQRFQLQPIPDAVIDTFDTVGDVQVYLDEHLEHPDIG